MEQLRNGLHQIRDSFSGKRRIRRQDYNSFQTKHTLPDATFQMAYNALAANAARPGMNLNAVNLILRNVPQNTIISSGNEADLIRNANATGTRGHGGRGDPMYRSLANYIQHNPRTGQAEARFGELEFAIRDGRPVHMNPATGNYFRRVGDYFYLTFETNGRV